MSTDPINVEWVSTHKLAFATDNTAASNEYWLCFREAGEELYRACPTLGYLPNEHQQWCTPCFERMQALYGGKWPKEKNTREGAFKVIRRYRQMRILQRYVGGPIELTASASNTDQFVIGQEASNTHQIVIGQERVAYAKLNGNHRLMSAFFLGLDEVPVVRLTSTACQTNGKTGETKVSG